MSEGKAHPYTWSAKINGCYKAEEIDKMHSRLSNGQEKALMF